MKPFSPNRYEAIFVETDITHLAVVNHRAASATRHRCLNYTLHIKTNKGEPHILYGCVPMDSTHGKYAPIVQFLRQIGWFRLPEDFDEKELKGQRILVDTGITFDKKLGLRPYVIRFYPLPK